MYFRGNFKELLGLILVRKALFWLLGLILVRKALFSLESIGVKSGGLLRPRFKIILWAILRNFGGLLGISFLIKALFWLERPYFG